MIGYFHTVCKYLGISFLFISSCDVCLDVFVLIVHTVNNPLECFVLFCFFAFSFVSHEKQQWLTGPFACHTV